jgi:hypothetical protein
MDTKTYASILIEIPVTSKDPGVTRAIKEHLASALETLPVFDTSEKYRLTCQLEERTIYDYAEVAQKWFLKNRDELVRDYYGKWICLHFDEAVGIYPTQEEAMYRGYEHCINTFIVKHIIPREEEIVHAIPGSQTTVGELENAGHDMSFVG